MISLYFNINTGLSILKLNFLICLDLPTIVFYNENMSSFIENLKESVALPLHFTGRTGRGKAALSAPHEINSSSSLNEILIFARHENASDVHVGALKPVIFRQYGHLKNMTVEPLSADHISHLIAHALPTEIIDHFRKTGDTEYVHSIDGYGRFRIALMKQQNGWDLTARLIPMEISKFEETGMPASCAGLTKWSQGLVLVTGPAGSGKTTTLAVLIEMINQQRREHILSIEDPIEIVYEPKQCQITQREVHLHSHTQDNALRAALREDPDILVVSELRDLSNIQLAITAAETGHLVFGTMNTINASQTISRVIDSFPAEEQPIIRNMISETLRGVICQQLIPKKDGNGMVPAFEVMIVTPSIANLIRSNKIAQINNSIATSKAFGMVLMDNSLRNLASSGIIRLEEACERAVNPAAISQTVTGVTLPKSKFHETGPYKDRILNELLQNGILENASETEVRLNPDTQIEEELIRKIAGPDSDRVWKILKQMAP